MKYEVIFCIFALVLTAGVVGAFAWALLGHSKGGRAEEARTADNLAGLREEYAHLVEQQAAGRREAIVPCMSRSDFAACAAKRTCSTARSSSAEKSPYHSTTRLET